MERTSILETKRRRKESEVFLMPCKCCLPECSNICDCDETVCKEHLIAALNNERLETGEDDNQEKKDC